MLLAIDPGADSGWARFDGATGRLVACGLNQPTRAFVPGLTRVVIERAHAGTAKASKKDLITLSIRAGEWGGLAKSKGLAPEYIEPATWKGSTPKPISHARIRAKLTAAETVVLNSAGVGIPSAKHHNICDAVGLGLYVLRRML